MTLRYTEAALALTLLAAPLAAQPVELFPAGATPGSEAARYVALAGDLAVLGVPGTEKAVVYERVNGTWTETATLVPIAFEAARGDRFGYSVAVGGQAVLVGAPETASGRGAAYLFLKEDGVWTQSERFFPDEGDNHRFGFDVAVDGDRIVIGAPRQDAPGSGPFPQVDAGAVYVYEAGEDAQGTLVWNAVGSPIYAATPVSSQNFGAAVDLDGDRLLAGAFTDPGAGLNGSAADGAAFVLDLSTSGAQATWTETAKLVSTRPEKWFGRVVDLDGDRALIGTDVSPFGGGNAYAFTTADGTTWTLEQGLGVSGLSARDYYASDVALDGDRAAVSARYSGLSGRLNGGAVFLFEHDGSSWAVADTLLYDPGVDNLRLGTGIALDRDRALVGAWESGGGTGTSLLFDLAQATSADATPEADLRLSAPAPNPASGTATLALTLDAPQRVRATVHDALGRTVAVAHDGPASGTLALAVETASLAPGLYIVRVTGERFAATQTLTVVR